MKGLHRFHLSLAAMSALLPSLSLSYHPIAPRTMPKHSRLLPIKRFSTITENVLRNLYPSRCRFERSNRSALNQATPRTMMQEVPALHDDSLDVEIQAASRRRTPTTVAASEAVPNTLSRAFQTFFLDEYNGPRACAALILGMAAWRWSLPVPFSFMDVGTSLLMILFWWIQEHWMHLHLLHSERDWYGKQVHQDHHEKPYYHVSIDPAPLMIGWLCVVHCFTRVLLPLPLALSATIGYSSAGLFYEWSHFIVHTRVPFRSYWKRMKDHHVRHHLVDDHNWLGFSVPAIDTLFGTNPDPLQVKRSKKQNNLQK